MCCCCCHNEWQIYGLVTTRQDRVCVYRKPKAKRSVSFIIKMQRFCSCKNIIFFINFDDDDGGGSGGKWMDGCKEN